MTTLKMTTHDLLDVLRRVQEIIPANTALPALRACELSLNGHLSAMATDLTENVIATFPGEEGWEPLELVVPPVFIEYLETLPRGGETTLSVDGTRIELQSGVAHARFIGLKREEYPPRPTHDLALARFEIAADQLRKRLAAVAGFCSSDEGRPVLTGVRWRIHPGSPSLDLAATDGFRLATARLEVPGPVEVATETCAAVVPQRAIKRLGRLLKDAGDNPVTVAMARNRITWFWSGTAPGGKPFSMEFSTLTIDGKFPDIEALLEQTSRGTAHQITVKRADLLSALAPAAVIARDHKVYQIHLSGEGNVLTVASTGSLEASSETQIPKAPGGAIDVKVNIAFFTPIVEALSDEGLTLQFRAANRPLMVASAWQTYLVMPFVC